MSLTDHERSFLIALSAEPKGRVGFPLTAYDKLMEHVGGLVEGGYLIQRRLGNYPGFQLTELGRQYLGGYDD